MEIQSAAIRPRVTLYTTGYCGYCIRAERLLAARGADVHRIRVDEHPAERIAMAQRTGAARSRRSTSATIMSAVTTTWPHSIARAGSSRCWEVRSPDAGAARAAVARA
jgi:glutaredoxin